MSSNRIKRHINRLILDPNNYRFIDRPDYKVVEESELADARVQQRTYNFIVGKNNSNIKDLISSFTTNGFLDIDQIQVKAVGDKYLVLEGNRRTATLKYLYDQFNNDFDVGKLTLDDFKSINLVEIIDEDPVQHLVSMGLHHISGKKRWSAVNEAKLINDLIVKYGKTEDEVCKALGITKQKLRKNRRTLFLIEQYKKSDYGDQFEANRFTIFETIISSPVMKTWIGWNDIDYEATNTVNIERLFSWISQTEEIDKDEDGVERSYLKEPIISQYRQIKDLAEFINDEKALKRMEESRSIAEGYTYSDAIGENRLKNALNSIKSEVNVAFNFSEHLTHEDYIEVERLINKLDRLIPSSEAKIIINDTHLSKYFTSVTNHFEEAFIHRYRILKKVKIKKLSRVNIFAGGNNMGKTSILEAFYLLSQLNDLNAFLGLEKYRGKFQNDFLSKWINKNFINEIELEGTFNKVDLSVFIDKETTKEDIERSGYLSTLVSDATIGEDTLLESSIHLYSNKEAELRFSKSMILCPATFTSPFRTNTDLLKKAHALAVTEGYIEVVIGFIKDYLDENITNIEMIDEDGDSRFMVSSASLEKPIDITKYGEGLQRIFEIALLMGYSQNGIICIDELDSAIHKSLLIKFTKFIQETAQRFNVQVFLSTHSKECIDAFVKNEYHNNEITAYALVNDGDTIKCKYIEGTRLEKLVETINLDIR